MSVPDYPLGETLDFKFTTRQFSDGVPTTLAGTPGVEVYEDNSITQITAGITLTVDFDSITGLNNLRIVATGANGYESGKSYAAVISAGTVGGTSVIGEVVQQFSIERSPALRPTTAGRTLDVAETGEAGVDLGNVTGTLGNANVGWVDGSNRVDVGSVLGTAQTAGDLMGSIGEENAAAAAGDPSTTESLMQYIKQLVNVLVGATGVTTFPAEAAPANNVSLAEVIRAIHVDVTGLNGDAMRGTDSAALASVCTEARLAELDAANIPSDVDAILTDTGTTLDTKIDDLQDASFLVNTTIATLASQTSFTLTAGSADNNAYLNCTIVVEDSATATQKARGLISAYTGATKTVTLKYDPAVFTMAVGDKVLILPEDSLKTTAANRQLNVAADGDLVEVNTLTGHTAQTGDSFARLGAPAGADVSADIAAIEAQTDDIGVAGAGLTAIPWNAAWDAEVESEVNDALDTAIAELTQAVPTATPTLRTGLMLLYMALRNRLDVTTSGAPDILGVYNNAGTLITKKQVTDDGSDYSEAKMESGP